MSKWQLQIGKDLVYIAAGDAGRIAESFLLWAAKHLTLNYDLFVDLFKRFKMTNQNLEVQFIMGHCSWTESCHILQLCHRSLTDWLTSARWVGGGGITAFLTRPFTFKKVKDRQRRKAWTMWSITLLTLNFSTKYPPLFPVLSHSPPLLLALLDCAPTSHVGFLLRSFSHQCHKYLNSTIQSSKHGVF